MLFNDPGGHGLSLYSSQNAIYANFAKTQVPVYKDVFSKIAILHFTIPLDFGFRGHDARPLWPREHNRDAKQLKLSSQSELRRRKCCVFLGGPLDIHFPFGMMISLVNDECSTGPLRPGRSNRCWPLVYPVQWYNISNNCYDASPIFLWGSIQYQDLSFLGVM